MISLQSRTEIVLREAARPRPCHDEKRAELSAFSSATFALEALSKSGFQAFLARSDREVCGTVVSDFRIAVAKCNLAEISAVSWIAKPWLKLG